MIPNLFVDNVDRCFLEFQIEAEDVHSRLRSAIQVMPWWRTTAFRCVIQMETFFRCSASGSKMLLQTAVSVSPESIEIAFSQKST